MEVSGHGSRLCAAWQVTLRDQRLMLTAVASRSYSKLFAYEASRILFRLGCDVRVYDPSGLPVKDDVHHDHPKVQELRELSKWSDGHVWVSPEQHGNLVRYRAAILAPRL